MRRAFSKALLKRLRWGGSGERSRTSIRALLLLLACLPPEPRYTRNRLNAVFLLAQSHGELYDNRASALYYLYFLVHTGNAGEHRSQRETALKQYRKRRSDFGLTGKLVLATDKGKVGAGIRCPFPRPR